MGEHLELISRAEAARRLGVSDDTVDKMIAVGELAATRVSRRVMVPAAAIGDYVITHAINPACVELVERTTRESGVPMLVEDDAAVEQVVAIVNGGDPRASSAG